MNCTWFFFWVSFTSFVLQRVSSEALLHPNNAVYNSPVDEIKNPDNVILTPHNFSFILNNPNICKHAPSPLHTLVVVHSSPNNWKRRMSIRRTWTTVGLYKSKSGKQRNVVAVFVMGKTNDQKTQQRLAFEHSEFGDIVQEDFIDAYKNLTYKNQLWMRFTKEFCQNAKFVIKSDDDIHINMIALLEHMDILDEKARSENSTVGLGKKLWCCRWDGMVSLRFPVGFQIKFLFFFTIIACFKGSWKMASAEKFIQS